MNNPFPQLDKTSARNFYIFFEFKFESERYSLASDLTDFEVDTYEDIDLNNGSFPEQFNMSHSILVNLLRMK